MTQDATAPERVVLVEFRRRRPFSVITAGGEQRSACYDVEWCRRDGCYYADMSGFGGMEHGPYFMEHRGATYWAAPGVTVTGGGRRLAALPPPCLETWPWPGVGDDQCVWCLLCEDWLPQKDSYPDENHIRLCDHLWWCDECCVWTGAGANPLERCEHPFEWLPGTPLDGSPAEGART